MVFFLAVFGVLLYSFVKSCLSARNLNSASPTARPSGTSGSGGGGGGGGGRWFPEDGRPYTYGSSGPRDAPPPYSKYPPSQSAAEDLGWRPGFWTGAALGGLGGYMASRRGGRGAREEEYGRPGARRYDWEERARPAAGWGFAGAGGDAWARRAGFDGQDRGEGPSRLGGMRRSTGLGGSNVR